MNHKTVLALLGAIIIAVAAPVAAVAAAAGPTVSLQISSLTKTLEKTRVRGETGWITKGGTPRGKCSGDSAAGALNRATHGRWAGKYYSSVGGIFITSILGVKPKGNDYWSVYVNGHAASKGICQLGLRRGERLLFKIVK